MKRGVAGRVFSSSSSSALRGGSSTFSRVNQKAWTAYTLRSGSTQFRALQTVATGERTNGASKIGVAALCTVAGSALAGYYLYEPKQQQEEVIMAAEAKESELSTSSLASLLTPAAVSADEILPPAKNPTRPVPFAMFNAEGQPNIYKVCLTGGPCGGKSTALSILSQRLNSLGFQVYLVPEAATILFTGGGRFAEWDLQKEVAFEESKIKTQMALEDAFMHLARASGKPSVVICDRGTVDSRAYIADETWNLLLNKTGWSVVALRDKQYDVVLHLISAAIGAEPFYQTLNNPTRSETLEEARKLDVRILNAWMGHPRLFVIDNSTDFAGKMARVMDILCRQMGVKSSTTLHKLLVKNPEVFHQLPVKYEEFQVEQTFLLKSSDRSEAGYVFIQKRGQYGVNTYRYSTKLLFDNEEAAIVERQISGLEYHTLAKQADPQREVVKKTVRCFLWNNKYYEMDYYHWPHPGLVLVYTDEVSAREKESLPPFIEVANDVTRNNIFSAYTLAGKNSAFPKL